MSHNSLYLTDANIPTRSFGSDHDPVLDGVTRGLEALFPPVYQDRDQELVRDDRDGRLGGPDQNLISLTV
ncbi:hypothetical protein [Methylobacterium nonmethylotrophicum]|uniref:Uncharacterized protein n=1 Tax=Methylobacterium nonmethylotrophicum TaxID=1141884 RepID=A0A4Z0NY80_9HYPH|nr:hypothetical protein [Methylobacterium nonmethylotrophicum]TGE02434.1 hypothetical protein EU555_01290 [Methylobacterium nonmethylotrophicum]